MDDGICLFAGKTRLLILKKGSGATRRNDFRVAHPKARDRALAEGYSLFPRLTRPLHVFSFDAFRRWLHEAGARRPQNRNHREAACCNKEGTKTPTPGEAGDPTPKPKPTDPTARPLETARILVSDK